MVNEEPDKFRLNFSNRDVDAFFFYPNETATAPIKQ